MILLCSKNSNSGKIFLIFGGEPRPIAPDYHLEYRCLAEPGHWINAS